MSSAPEEAKLIRAARQGNDSKPNWVLQKGRDAVLAVLATDPGRALKDVKVACLGLAFKPNIDDLRESPAMQITQGFGKLGCQVLAVEPHIKELPATLSALPITLTTLEAALATADVICVLVKHSAFKGLRSRLAEGVILVDVVGI